MSTPARSAKQITDQLTALSKDMHALLQDPFFDAWAIQRRKALLDKLATRASQAVSTVFLGHHLQHARAVHAGRDFVHLPEDFLEDPPARLPAGSVVLLLNNDIGERMPRYMDWYREHPEALFVVWDWDSQHWLYMSCLLAMHSDVYVPAASENVHLLSQFNPWMLGPVFAAAHQWTRAFLFEHMEVLLAARSSTPLGRHVLYEAYPRRNRAVATLAQHFPDVGFGTDAFKQRSDLDNLREWAGHKTHWIVPVLAGVPIRIYNALVTGGIPVLPSFYRNLPEIAILGELPSYYHVADLLQPQAVNDEAVARFDAGGQSALITRVAQGVAQHHVDARCEQLLLALEDMLGRALRSDSHHALGYVGARL